MTGLARACRSVRSIRRELTRVLGILAACAAFSKNAAADHAGATEDPSGPFRVLLLPYQPIYRSAPPEKATRTTEFLFRELQKRRSLDVVRGGLAVGPPQTSRAEPMKAAVAAAERSEQQKDIVSALAARRAVITQMEEDASRIATASEHVMAHHLLARAQAWAGRDASARETVKTAVRMNPGLELPPSQFSRTYRRWVSQAATEVTRERTGELLVRSALPGATVFLDGREMDVAPVVLRRVTRGKHLVGAKVEGVPVYRAVVQVKAGTRTEFRINFGGTVGGAAVGAVNDAISLNGLPKTAVRSAVKAGETLKADYVVAGGISRGEDHFNVHTFVFDVGRANVQPLESVQLDLDLLTAEADVFAIVQQIEDAVESFSGERTTVTRIDRRIRRKSPVHEIDAQPEFPFPGRQAKDPYRRPQRPRKVIRVLESGRVKIKDEEN